MNGYPTTRPPPQQQFYNDYDPYSRGGPPPPRREDPYSRGGGGVVGQDYNTDPPYDPYSRREDLPPRQAYGYSTVDTRTKRNYVPAAPNGPYSGPPHSGPHIVPHHTIERHSGQNGRDAARNGGTPNYDVYGRAPQKNGYAAAATAVSPIQEPVVEGSYNLDHLATFTVGAKQGLMTPNDGIQKLRQMETTSGIWTMRVMLVMDRQDLLVIDRQTGEEMERFPYNLLTDITAVTNQDRRDIYNNIVLFTVMPDQTKRAPAEMHLFQVIGAPAQECVDDIKGTKGRKQKQYRNPARDSAAVQEQVREYELAAQHAARATDAYRPAPTRPGDAFRQSMHRRDDDNDTVISERTDKDVQLLNHCFDDIEQFVGRLQHAAEAFKELDARRRGRPDNRRRGDGMLTMRARPPPAKDFIDIFQKFKLSFNLLAKLKPHIHDPNAPELVHFLFTPLSLVVEASKDPRQGTPDLAAKVVAPLLTPDAKELLLNCLTSKEADLWVSLGEAWKLSRDEWNSYVPPYYPRFSDGWSPAGFEDEYKGRNEDDYRGAGAGAAGGGGGGGRNSREAYYRDAAAPPPRDRDADRRRDEQKEREQREREARERESRDREEREAREREERETRERQMREQRERDLREQEMNSRGTSQAAFLRELQTRGALAYQALHDRSATNEKEITLHKGDIVEVMDKRRNWWKLRNSRGQVGHAPYTILQQADSPSNDNGGPAAGVGAADFEERRRGVARAASTRPLSPLPSSAQPLPHLGSPSTHGQDFSRWPQQQQQEDNHSNKSRRSSSFGSGQETSKEKQQGTNKEKKQEPSKEKKEERGKEKKQETVLITAASQPEEVKKWLKSKGFSNSARQILSGKNGEQMFKLQKDQLERMCGKKEGSSLYSQIQVQRTMTGYNTGKFKAEELQAVLRQRRQKQDSETSYENSEEDSDNNVTYHHVLSRPPP